MWVLPGPCGAPHVRVMLWLEADRMAGAEGGPGRAEGRGQRAEGASQQRLRHQLMGGNAVGRGHGESRGGHTLPSEAFRR